LQLHHPFQPNELFPLYRKYLQFNYFCHPWEKEKDEELAIEKNVVSHRLHLEEKAKMMV